MVYDGNNFLSCIVHSIYLEINVMCEILQTSCPLCKSEAQFHPVDYSESNYYKCPICTKFIIARSSENVVRQSTRGAELSDLAIAATTGTDLEVLEIAGGYMADYPLNAQVVKKSAYRFPHY